jgi:hypothetical protein
LALFIAAETFLVAAVGVASLPLVAGWALAGGVVALVWWLVRGSLARTVLSGVLMVVCVALTTLEGLFFLPAVAVLFIAAASGRHHGHVIHVGR